jgi:hypothetical protein
MNHLDGDLTVKSLPTEAGHQRVEISGWAKLSLLPHQEAARAIGCGRGRCGRYESNAMPFCFEAGHWLRYRK